MGRFSEVSFNATAKNNMTNGWVMPEQTRGLTNAFRGKCGEAGPVAEVNALPYFITWTSEACGTV